MTSVMSQVTHTHTHTEREREIVKINNIKVNFSNIYISTAQTYRSLMHSPKLVTYSRIESTRIVMVIINK